MFNKTLSTILSMMVLLFIVLYGQVLATDFGPIKDPKPNIIETEKHYIKLERVKIVSEDLGNGEYLLQPISLAVSNATKDVFVYDLLQAKIFKLDSQLEKVNASFGNKGEDVDNFSGDGRGYWVKIRIGRDGQLYAHDLRGGKILAFDQDGKYIRYIKNQEGAVQKPLVDSSGLLINLTVKDNMIKAYDEKNTPVFSFPCRADYFKFLYSTPETYCLNVDYIHGEADLIEAALTVKSRYLLFFTPSATMVIIEGNKVSKQFQLWPREPLNVYKELISKKNAKDKKGITYLPLYCPPFADEDRDDVFYIQCTGRNKGKPIIALYQFNDNGQLLKVLYLDVNEKSPHVTFMAKKDDRYYAIEGDQLALYKE
jgi:hypothetical protein